VRRERYHICNKQAGFCLSLAVAAAAAPWVRREDDIDADEVGILGPTVRVRAEVADEDEDLEGAAESKSRLIGWLVACILRIVKVDGRDYFSTVM
jgi:hypothetical protein